MATKPVNPEFQSLLKEHIAPHVPTLSTNQLSEKQGLTKWAKQAVKERLQKLLPALRDLEVAMNDQRFTSQAVNPETLETFQTYVAKTRRVVETLYQTYENNAFDTLALVKFDEKTVTPELLNEHLEKIRANLADLCAENNVRVKEGETRRSFIKGLVAVFIAHQLSPLAKAFATTSNEWRAPPGLYIQIGAFKNRDNAEGLALRYKPVVFAVHDSGEAPARYKVLYPTRIADVETAFGSMAYMRQVNPALFSQEFGVTEVHADGTTTWLKGTAQAVLKKKAELARKSRPRPQPSSQRHATPTKKWTRDAAVENALSLYKGYNDEEIDPTLVFAMIEVESSGHRRARSHKGASGYMQVMPATWKYFHWRSKEFTHKLHNDGKKYAVNHNCDVYDVAQNIDAGVHYLAYLHRKYKPHKGEPKSVRLEKIVMAYNAGEPAVNSGKAYGYKETVDYLKKVKRSVLNRSNQYKKGLLSNQS